MRGKPVPKGTICKVKDCSDKHASKGYCSKHASQMRRYGKIKKRTTRDPNELIIEGDITRVILYNVQSEPIAEALIDTEDIDKIKGYKWSKNPSRGYAISCNPPVFMHHLIWGKKEEIDHINRNNLDNRKFNFRKATAQQNSWNRGKLKRNTSGYIGVSLHKPTQKWMVTISVNNKNQNLGLFINKKNAAKAYDKKALELRGEFAVLNFS